MTNDDLRTRAHIIALTATMNAMLKRMRNADPELIAGIGVDAVREAQDISDDPQLLAAARSYIQSTILDGVKH